VDYTDRAEVPDRPFCCERCRLVDLGKWLNEEYCVSDPIHIEPETPPAPKPSEPPEEPPAP